MKTVKDLNELIPTIIDMVFDKPEIGSSCYEQDEDGYGGECDEPEQNTICYNKDGWYIEVSYDVSGEWIYDPGDYWTPPSEDLRRAWGEVTEIFASYTDEETGEEYEFTEDELAEMESRINKELEDF